MLNDCWRYMKVTKIKSTLWHIMMIYSLNDGNQHCCRNTFQCRNLNSWFQISNLNLEWINLFSTNLISQWTVVVLPVFALFLGKKSSFIFIEISEFERSSHDFQFTNLNKMYLNKSFCVFLVFIFIYMDCNSSCIRCKWRYLFWIVYKWKSRKLSSDKKCSSN